MNLTEHFKIHLPIASDGVFWNGKPDEFSNIYHNLNYSQEFGLTPYAKIWDKEKKNWTYGTFEGKPRPHNGHDFASNDIITLVTPCKVWISYVGFDPGGYGNCCFMETETVTENGETVKMEFVLGHMKELSALAPYHWYEAGTIIGIMGNTGMSSGQHTHFGGRPWIKKTGGWEYLFKDDGARGYIDLTDLLIEKPIYNKQELINQAKFMDIYEKKIIIEGEKPGRKGIIIDGVFQEITKDREAAACLYALANNGLGTTISSAAFNNLPKGKTF